MEMEEFMGQYGWMPKEPIDMSILDWSDKTAPVESTYAPAAATGFDQDSSQAAESQETNKAPILRSQNKTQAASYQNPIKEETIFDIGLSDATLKLLLSKKKPSQQAPTAPQGSISVVHPPPSIPQLKLPAPSIPGPAPLATCPSSEPSGSINLLDESDLDDSHVASPILKLRSKLHCLSSIVDSSLSQSYIGATEISPGLPRRMTPVSSDDTVMQSPSMASVGLLRKSSELLLSKTPECPELQTMDVRKLISKHVAEQPVKTTPEEPLLTSQLRNLSTVPKVGTEKEGTPETPELTHHHQKKTLTETPETPVLETMVWKKKF